MTSFQDLADFWPTQCDSVGDYLRRCGIGESRARLYERYFGFSEIRVADGISPADQLVSAARNLSHLDDRRRHIRYILQARTLPVGAPYPSSTVHQVRAALGLEHAQAFCVTQHACASGLLAVELAGRLLAGAGDPEALALVVTGEKAIGVETRVIPETGVMGECTAAILVGLGGRHDRVLSYATATQGDFEDGAAMTDEQRARFQDVYPQVLADVIASAVQRAGSQIDDIDLILPHNVNRMSWLPVLRRLGLRGSERLFLRNLPLIGHCFGADPFINYLTARNEGRLRRGRRYVLTSVGLGATFSAMVVEH
ncbi:3-oxoacyl-[acyl-carrier-protein] synthase III C-terminal domain-containing protein [Streptomyces sp. LS1784]|uniref:3-oxoacyl-[acyl-carrier-protein] synthase III C-terminal domain-containing protein n=1 Tax=Streptomyces sp. LS1784 TaxID=2851533 RepID=UPI001CCBE9BA|nr:3-oxoacyl-[acyl-carrier-protein] synthase III C-terminal domain-containing protein [Streptomyces sp. LS1784]